MAHKAQIYLMIIKNNKNVFLKKCYIKFICFYLYEPLDKIILYVNLNFFSIFQNIFIHYRPNQYNQFPKKTHTYLSQLVVLDSSNFETFLDYSKET